MLFQRTLLTCLIWLNCKSDLDCPGIGGILIALEMSNCEDGSAFCPSENYTYFC